MIARRLFTLGLLVVILAGGAPFAAAQSGDDEAAISALVETMEAAIRAADAGAYLALVDLADPVFALEHTRLTEDWADFPARDAQLSLRDLVVEGDAATARLTVQWRMADYGLRRARYAVQFTRGADGAWRYAGELWQTTATDHFAIHAAPGVPEDVVAAVLDYLPEVYDLVTASLAFEPQHVMHIKIYTDANALVANTLYSLPAIAGWNEPGESLKVRVMDDGSAPPARVVAHEFVHFVNFEMGEAVSDNTPWFLMEGLAEQVSSPTWPQGRAEQQVAFIAAEESAGTLPPWQDLVTYHYAETPTDLWRYVYAGGYAFVEFVAQTYGEDARNAWFVAMAHGETLGEATETVLETDFAGLDAAFRAWLDAPQP